MGLMGIYYKLKATFRTTKFARFLTGCTASLPYSKVYLFGRGTSSIIRDYFLCLLVMGVFVVLINSRGFENIFVFNEKMKFGPPLGKMSYKLFIFLENGFNDFLETWHKRS